MRTRIGTRTVAAMVLGGFTTLPVLPAHADTAAEIRALRANMEKQAARLKELEAVVAKQRHATNIANAAHAKGGAPVPPPVFVSFKNGLFVETEDKAYSFKIGGRVQVVGGGISDPLNGFAGQAGIRRARLSVEGEAAKIWFYKFEYDFANTGVAGIRDAYLGIQHPALTPPFAKDPVYLQVGNFKEPFSIEALNSGTILDFIERPLPVDAFAPQRHIGAAVGAYGDNWTTKVGVFSTSPEDASLNPARGVPGAFGVLRFPGNGTAANRWWQPTGGGQYLDVAARVTWAPIKDEHSLLHLGLSGRYHDPNDATGLSDNRVLSLGSKLRSEGNVLGQALLGTPDLSCGTVIVPVPAAVFNTTAIAGKCVNNVESFGAELAVAYGPVSVRAEYLGSRYNRNAGALAQAALVQSLTPNGVFIPGAAFVPNGTSHYFDGYYVTGQWWLTGEEIAASYNVKSKNGASFSQVKIKDPLSKGGFGAWGLAARFSSINLDSGPFHGQNLNNLLYYTTIVAPNPAARAYIANAGIVGGRQQNLTVGVNWYPDNGVHFQANWTRVMNVSAPFNLNPAQGYFSGSHPNLFQVSAQVYW
jgi:phosphate-selective porin OprO/OprP